MYFKTLDSFKQVISNLSMKSESGQSDLVESALECTEHYMELIHLADICASRFNDQPNVRTIARILCRLAAEYSHLSQQLLGKLDDQHVDKYFSQSGEVIARVLEKSFGPDQLGISAEALSAFRKDVCNAVGGPTLTGADIDPYFAPDHRFKSNIFGSLFMYDDSDHLDGIRITSSGVLSGETPTYRLELYQKDTLVCHLKLNCIGFVSKYWPPPIEFELKTENPPSERRVDLSKSRTEVTYSSNLFDFLKTDEDGFLAPVTGIRFENAIKLAPVDDGQPLFEMPREFLDGPDDSAVPTGYDDIELREDTREERSGGGSAAAVGLFLGGLLVKAIANNSREKSVKAEKGVAQDA